MHEQGINLIRHVLKYAIAIDSFLCASQDSSFKINESFTLKIDISHYKQRRCEEIVLEEYYHLGRYSITRWKYNEHSTNKPLHHKKID